MEKAEVTLIAIGPNGDPQRFTLFAAERQYTIGGNADISLGHLEPLGLGKHNHMNSLAGYLTFIDGTWYFRCAQGHRRGRRAVFINERRINAKNAEVRLKHGFTLSFGEKDPVVVTFLEEQQFETLKDSRDELTGLFDLVKLEFEKLNSDLKKHYKLDEKANTGVIMSHLEGEGLFNSAFEYNLARGMRNIIAHPSEDVAEKIRREYIHQSMSAMRTIRTTILDKA
jgi:hypothetical protein